MKWLCRICLRLWSHKEKQKREEALPEIYKHIMIYVQSTISFALYMVRQCVAATGILRMFVLATQEYILLLFIQ